MQAGATAFALLFLFILRAVAEEPPRLVGPDGERPPVLELLGAATKPFAVAVSADGLRLALATAGGEEARATTLTIFSVEEPTPTSVEVPGRVRDLLFSRDGETLFGLQHRAAPKSQGETYLLRVEVESLKARQAMRLPAGASGLDHWPEDNSLLVACSNEIRTIVLPELRSGRLYRVPGPNLSVASVGGSRVLVGQENALLLVDLDDPSSREGLPIREQLALPAPALTLAAARDGSTVLARLADSRILRVAIDPLASKEQGTALGLLRPGRVNVTARQAKAPTPPPSVKLPPQVDPVPPPLPRPSPSEREPDAEPPATPDELPPPASAVPAPPPRAPEPAPRPTPDTAPVVVPPGDQVAGRVVGAKAGDAIQVVLLGPDNLLREATRVRLASGGRWSARGLTPGRYRVQLDGGGNRVLVCDPAFLVIDVGAEPLAAPEIHVLRML